MAAKRKALPVRCKCGWNGEVPADIDQSGVGSTLTHTCPRCSRTLVVEITDVGRTGNARHTIAVSEP